MSDRRRIGYIRVSTRDPGTDRQLLLLEAQCDALHVEHISAVARARPGFDHVLADLKPGDTFVVVEEVVLLSGPIRRQNKVDLGSGHAASFFPSQPV